MSAKKNYSRYFIILQEDEKGFSVDANKMPTGYCKIENKNNKCKISYYAQNLSKSKEPYYMILICAKKGENKLIKLGKMNIDEYGRAEISNEYNGNNIADSGITMDKIKGAAIVHFQSVNMRAALTGFISGTKLEDWKNYVVTEEKSQLRENKQEIQKEVAKAPEVKDNKVEKTIEVKREKVDNTDKIKSENNIFEEYEKNIEKTKDMNNNINTDKVEEVIQVMSREDNKDNSEDVKNVKKESIESKTNKKSDDVDKEEEYREKYIENKDHHNKEEECRCKNRSKHKKDCKCNDDYSEKYNEDYPIGKQGEFFKNLAKDLEEVTGVCSEIGKCKWYKIPVEKLENMNETMDYNKYTVLYYPMVCYYPYIKKYGHYLLGYKCDLKGKMRYLVYAIPGTKSIHDQPFGGSTGFTTWVCKDDGDDKMDSLGYWVMFYDFKNSRIMMPVI